MLGSATRAYEQARAYADTRSAFGQPIIHYPLVQENLAQIKAENTAGLAGAFGLLRMQDAIDKGRDDRRERVNFIRLMANIDKHLISRWTVDNCHRALDTLAGNGAIESFSSIPRLLRDSVIEENWEGTHNTLRMQVLRDLTKLALDDVYRAIMTEELAALGDAPERAWIAGRLDQIDDEMAALRAAEPAIQTLLVQEVMRKMGTLYFYLMLLVEGRHQQLTTGVARKLDSAAYFRLLHLEPSQRTYDRAYLTLIASVVDAPPPS